MCAMFNASKWYGKEIKEGWGNGDCWGAMLAYIGWSGEACVIKSSLQEVKKGAKWISGARAF